ncbi:hypothetical protein [Flexivirga caeni]|uniref:hypothetical protein n=1 Tax=Flexivirga caeni TaxID=2294115 RepID=UPI0013158568|nr:hypothetical protein [Flexivirga caeni]
MDVKEGQEGVVDDCLIGAVVIVDVEGFEEDVVEVAADLVDGAFVEGVDVRSQTRC